ncbi:MAG TPA: 50S ribosomal protein L11 methyltransferase [Acidobacteriota bacterium]|nr:50S ribosomal protein L11 methyltransferase [Acidobacteriota bacterium]
MNFSLFRLITALILAVFGEQPLFKSNPLASMTAYAQDSIFENKKIVPFVPSPQEVVDKMLDLAGVKSGDLLYDLGSGDGRIVISAAKRGARAVGFEIDGDLVIDSQANIQKAGVRNLAEIRHQDILTVDFSPATVVTMYLLPDVNLKLMPNLRSQLTPGSRVISHAFDMGDWRPHATVEVLGRNIYLWTILPK